MTTKRRLVSFLRVTPLAIAALLFLCPGGVAASSPMAGGPGAALTQTAPAPPFPSQVQDGGLAKSGTLSSQLDELHRLDVLGRQLGRPLNARTGLVPMLEAEKSAGRLHIDEAGNVEVFVTTSGPPTGALAGLVALGLRPQRVDSRTRTVQGNLPISALDAAAAIPGVLSVRQPDYPVLNAGSVTTQGDAILHADELRAKLGVDGTGVRVGVLSDGVFGLATAQGTGDLPPAVDTTTCDVVGADPTVQAAGSEGTAMLEIVHDLAPGAQLWFGYSGAGTQTGGTSLDFMAAVNCLAAHVDVVVDDISFFGNGPYDGTSPVSANAAAALNDASNPIRAYYTAVGNYAGGHYKEPFVASGSTVTSSSNPADSWSMHGFQSTASTTNAGHTVACPVASAYSCGDQLVMAPGATAGISLEWNDAFGNSSNDYDLLLLDETGGQLLLASADRQSGAGSDPAESFSFQNPYPAAANFDIVIGNYRSAAAARTFNMFVFCDGCQTLSAGSVNVYHNFNTAAGSVPNNGDAAGGVVSLGAVGAGSSVIEPYSSEGPTADGRTKPDATAVDAVSVSGAGGFPTTFRGTSAAAPHAAGVAALLLSCNPSLKLGASGTPAALARGALHTAVAGTGALLSPLTFPPNTYGIGPIDAWEATGPAQCQSEMNAMVLTGLRDVAAAGPEDTYIIADCAIREFVFGVQRRLVHPDNCTINPQRLAVDGAGNVYVTDDGQCGVYEISGGSITTLAGPAPGQPQRCFYAGDGGPATQASLAFPTSIAVDGSGDVFVIDSHSCRVRKISGTTISTVTGTGACANSGDGGPAASAAIDPTDIAVDASGDLYIASLCAVREVSGGVIDTVAGTVAQSTDCAATGDGGPPLLASFQAWAVAVDSQGELFIADTTNCDVRRVANNVISTVAGIGRLEPGLACSYNGFDGYTGAAIGTAIEPDDVAVDNLGNVYIGEFMPFDTTSDSVLRVARPVDHDLDGYPDAQELALGENPLTYCDMMRADVDGDGQVTIVDLGTMAVHFLQTVPTVPGRYDQDGDGQITIVDLGIAAVRFLQSVTACP